MVLVLHILFVNSFLCFSNLITNLVFTLIKTLVGCDNQKYNKLEQGSAFPCEDNQRSRFIPVETKVSQFHTPLGAMLILFAFIKLC